MLNQSSTKPQGALLLCSIVLVVFMQDLLLAGQCSRSQRQAVCNNNNSTYTCLLHAENFKVNGSHEVSTLMELRRALAGKDTMGINLDGGRS